MLDSFDIRSPFSSLEDFLSEYGNVKDSESVNKLHTILRPFLVRRPVVEMDSPDQYNSCVG
jgi:hypothetical protein